MFEHVPGFESGGPWSVGHGIIKRYPALALPRLFIDP